AESARVEPADLPAAFRAARQLAPHAEGARDGEIAAAGAVRDEERAVDAAAARDGEPRPREEWSLAAGENEPTGRVLKAHRGNATTAAKQLGISRTTLWRKLRAYGLARRGG